MDLGIIIAIVGSSVTMIGVVLAMMFWVRSESNNIRGDATQDRRDILSLIQGIHDEMKDFHYRL